MLYIVRVFEYGDAFEYEYGNMDHALFQYAQESTADLVEYERGKEKVLQSKRNGEGREFCNYEKEN